MGINGVSHLLLKIWLCDSRILLDFCKAKIIICKCIRRRKPISDKEFQSQDGYIKYSHLLMGVFNFRAIGFYDIIWI